MRAWPLAAYAVVYTLALLALTLIEGRSPVEPLFVLFTYGLGMSGLAWWSTRGLEPRLTPVRAPRRELQVTLGYLLVLAAFITWGLPGVRSTFPGGWQAELAVLLAKVAFFILLPYLLWRRVFGYRLAELVDLRSGLKGHWRPTLVMAGAVLGLQAFFGRALRDWHTVASGPTTVGLAAAAALLWLILDVGFVEETPFRALLQTRLAAATRSEAAGIVGMALAFGLAHAPGLYLRPELMGEAVGSHPSLLHAVSYSVALTSLSGFLYGVLWWRTRNLWVVAIVHAAQDWLPTLVDTLRSGVLGA